MPSAERIFFIRHALRAGFTIEDIFLNLPAGRQVDRLLGEHGLREDTPEARA